MLHDPSQLRLGRLPTRHDPRTLKLARYVAGGLPVPPSMQNWGVVQGEWGMMLNDRLGDCTIAAAAHMVLLDTAARDAPLVIPDAAIESAYSAVGGYVPGQSQTDNGAVELDVLKYWHKTGIGGHKISAFVSIPAEDQALIKTAIWLFGAVYAGVALPIDAQDQDIWQVSAGGASGTGRAGSWGGHAVPLVGYDTRAFNCITWGAPKWLTESWWAAYGDEAYAVVSEDWAPPGGVAPNSFNLDQLKADLAAIS